MLAKILSLGRRTFVFKQPLDADKAPLTYAFFRSWDSLEAIVDDALALLDAANMTAVRKQGDSSYYGYGAKSSLFNGVVVTTHTLDREVPAEEYIFKE